MFFCFFVFFFLKIKKKIHQETIDSLNETEVKEALLQRGFQKYLLDNSNFESHKELLQNWIQFSLNCQERSVTLFVPAIILRAR